MADSLLKIASCMAGNADTTCRAIAHYIGRKLGLAVQFVDEVDWQQREALLDEEEIQVCWLCGLPYVWKADADSPAIELCAVPVMKHRRYQNRPVYFSDVIVHSQSGRRSFAELRGASWVYNEPRSHSGYNVVRHYLAQLGETSGYFGTVAETGAHQMSLRMIVNREADACAIDSTVLEAELEQFPELKMAIRIIETIGPSPMPPWVCLKSLPWELRKKIRAALLAMHTDGEGMDIIRRWGISHFVAVDDCAYDPIRRMSREAAGVSLSAS